MKHFVPLHCHLIGLVYIIKKYIVLQLEEVMQEREEDRKEEGMAEKENK